MSRRTIVAAAVLVLAVLTGCTPQPAPSPTPSPRFTSEADAYKAAEATYRAYIAVLNKVDLSRPATFEDVYRWETGTALDADKKNLTAYHADGDTVEGSTVITLLEPGTVSADLSDVTLHGCLDVSDVVLRDKNGESLVSADRRPVQAIRVHVTTSDDSPTGLLVDKVSGRSDGPKC